MPAPFDIEAISQSRNSEPNRYLDVRFKRDGTFLPAAGNTVVRPVMPGSETETILNELRERLQALPWGDHFAYTDPHSCHMTVFEGVLDTRREQNYWPADLPLDAPLGDTTDYFAGRLRGFEGPGPFNMRIAEVTPHGLKLTGATQRDEETARALRDALTGPFGYRSPRHDAYTFHITLAYIMEWLPDEMIDEYCRALADLTDDLGARLPKIELNAPALCTFADMNGFPPVMELRGG